MKHTFLSKRIRACALVLVGFGSLALTWPVQNTSSPPGRSSGASAEYLDAAAFAHARYGSGPSGIEALFQDMDLSQLLFNGF